MAYNTVIAKSPSSRTISELISKAKNGDQGAQYQLGLKYLDGNGVKKNDDEAKKWLRKAALQGNPGAITILCILENDIDDSDIKYDD
ncbi:MAG: SEL1-like repeat protein [Bacteroidetes bacterium]|nr:SEL1-like repeat protein [Bacteroidota bacterium]